MRRIIVTYNYLTLCRSLQYTQYKWYKDDNIIIYMNLICEIPNKVKEDNNIKTIECDNLDKKRGFNLINGACLIAKKLTKTCIEEIGTEKEVEFVCFRDNEVQEATVIKTLRAEKNRSIKIVLMEEGNGLYANTRISTRYNFIKRIIYLLNRVSVYPLKDRTQGMNEMIDKVICKNPAFFLRKRKDVTVEKLNDMFTVEFNNYFVSSISPEFLNRKYDYVFLSQPFTDYRSNFKELLDNHKKLYPQIFSILSKYGTVLIKPHPRDDFNYKLYENNRVSVISDDLKMVPFECLIGALGNPQIVSMYSSACFNINNNKKSIFLGKIFGIPDIQNLFDNDLLQRNNIVLCDDIEEFENTINKS